LGRGKKRSHIERGEKEEKKKVKNLQSAYFLEKHMSNIFTIREWEGKESYVKEKKGVRCKRKNNGKKRDIGQTTL